MAMVEVTELAAVLEQDAVTLPVEAIGEDDLALGARWNTGQVLRRADLVAELQVELTLVGDGESVWLPELHRHILPDRALFVHVRRSLDRGVADRTTANVPLGGVTPTDGR
jgi:hypothetical protein